MPLRRPEILRSVIGDEDAPPKVEEQCELCELHPGDSDNLTWQEVIDTFGVPDWNVDETRPIAPGGEVSATFRVQGGGGRPGVGRTAPR